MEFLVLFVAVVLGAVVQGAVGFGLALVVPALTLFLPEALPATVLLLAMPLAAVMAAKERRAVDVPGLTYVLLGRLGGRSGAGGFFCWCRTSISRRYSGASLWWPYSRVR